MNQPTLRTLVPIVVLAGLTACTGPSPTSSSGPTTPSPGISAAPPVVSGSPTAPGAATATPGPSAASGSPARAACPVSAAALQPVSGLSAGHRIDPDHIRCAQRWATAGVIAAKPDMQGDGVILFEYRAGTWTRLGEGSALECAPYGIPEEIGDQVGCRDH